MSEIKKEIIFIDVTKGDCLEPNRRNGKSNTGTYFISSLKDIDKYKEFVDENNKYFLNLDKVYEYAVLFKNLPTSFLESYNGKGANFSTFSGYLTSLKNNPNIKVSTRINDSRVFLRFVDNGDPVVNAFRNLLYEDISNICIEKTGNEFEIYPYLNAKQLNKGEAVISNGLELDE